MMRLHRTGLALVLLAGTAQAAPLRDASTGLAVDPPPGYSAMARAPDKQGGATIAVKRPTDTDTGCEVGFAPSTANARFTQDRINALTGTPAWRDAILATLAPVYDVAHTGVVELSGIRGLALLADFKPRPELPPRAQEIRSFFTVLETPRGRTTLVCVAEKAEFSQRQPEFEAIARATTAP